jgi:hypothetical protein
MSGDLLRDDARMRIHVMYLVTYRTSHRLIDVAVFRSIQSPERGTRFWGNGT